MLDAPWICFCFYGRLLGLCGLGMWQIWAFFFMCICVSYVKVGFFLQVHMGVKSMQDVAFSRWPMCI